MTYKGVYRDGIVIIQGEVDLQNGATVDVNLRSTARPQTRRKPPSPRADAKKLTSAQIAALFRSSAWDLMRRTKMTKKQRIAAVLDARGTWKGRPDWKGKSSARVAAELRTRASRRGRND